MVIRRYHHLIGGETCDGGDHWGSSPCCGSWLHHARPHRWSLKGRLQSMLILDLLECHSRKCFQLNFSPRLVLVPWQVVPGGWCSHLASWGRWRHLLRRWGWCSGCRWAEAPGSRTHQDKFSFSLTISRPYHPSQWWPGCRSSRQPLDLSRGLRCRE